MINNFLLEQLYQNALRAHMNSELDKALGLYNEILSNDSNHHNALHYKGVIYLQKNEYDKAIKFISKSLQIKSDNFVALSNIGLAYQNSSNIDKALESYILSLKYNPNLANAHYNIASIYQIKGNTQLAIKHYKISIELNPNSIDSHINLGNVYQENNDLNSALKHYDACILLDPMNANAINNKANILHSLNDFSGALNLYLDSIKIDPNNASIYNNLANIYRDLNLLEDSKKAYLNCIKIDPSFEFIYGSLLNIKMLMCDWHNINTDISLISNSVANSLKVSPPFPLLSVIDDPYFQLNAAKIWYSSKTKQSIVTQSLNLQTSSQKIRVAYFSSDFRSHAVSFLIAELFTLHNRESFEVFGFCISTHLEDDISRSISSSFDYFYKVNHMSDIEIVVLCRQLHLDIAIDLNGWTSGNRFSLFTNRLAPIQISYLGYLGTTGSDCFDYIIADKIIIPPHLRKFYTEKIIYLPNFQVNDSRRQKSISATKSLNELIPEDFFVFCCFNNTYKITPIIFDTWISILNDVPESILLLSGENPWSTDNLLNYALSKGINKNRIHLLARSSRDEYLSRYSASNLFLDTFPYCAGTTASDSLWSGVPVLTCMGNSFASRMGASILNSVGLQELITTNLMDYHKLAVAIASNPSFYFEIREKLRLNLLTFPLFNSRLFTNNIEKAFVKVHQNRLDGLDPDHIFISSDFISF